MNTENKKKLDYKELRLTDDYQYPSEEEQEEKQEEKQGEKQEEEQEKETISDVNKFKEWVNKQEKGINTESFKRYFSIQRPSSTLKYLYK